MFWTWLLPLLGNLLPAQAGAMPIDRLAFCQASALKSVRALAAASAQSIDASVAGISAKSGEPALLAPDGSGWVSSVIGFDGDSSTAHAGVSPCPFCLHAMAPPLPSASLAYEAPQPVTPNWAEPAPDTHLPGRLCVWQPGASRAPPSA